MVLLPARSPSHCPRRTRVTGCTKARTGCNQYEHVDTGTNSRTRDGGIDSGCDSKGDRSEFRINLFEFIGRCRGEIHRTLGRRGTSSECVFPCLLLTTDGLLSCMIKQRLSPQSRRNAFIPIPTDLLSIIAPILNALAGLVDYVNGYALVYVGITGDPFWPSAKRAVRLAGKRGRSRLLDCE